MKNRKFQETFSDIGDPGFEVGKVFKHRPDFHLKHLQGAPNTKIILDLLALEKKRDNKKK